MLSELKEIAEEVTAKYLAIAEEKLGYTGGMPSITFYEKGRAAGRAYYKENKVAFNKVLFAENKDSFIERTIPHELAHLVSYSVYGPKRGGGHGKAWKHVMGNVFGCDNSRCHEYDMSNAYKGGGVAYICDCGPTTLSTIRHNRVLKGTTYWCGKCKTNVRQPMEARKLHVRRVSPKPRPKRNPLEELLGF